MPPTGRTRRLPLTRFEIAMLVLWLTSFCLMLRVERADEHRRAAMSQQLQALIKRFHTEPDQQRLLPEFNRLGAALNAWHPSPWRRRFLALVILGTSAFSISRLRRFWLARQQEKRRDAGLCPHCGYDLRGSPERCPECGTSAKGGTA